MAESTQTVGFNELVRRLARTVYGAGAYYEGTASTSTTTLTGSGTVFPTWAANGVVIAEVSSALEVRTVSSRGGDTSLTLGRAFSSNLASGTAYVLVQVQNEETGEEILDYIRDGLNRFYNDHDWEFMKPYGTIDTVAAYSTGTIAATNGVVTLTSGTWPTWAASGEILIEGTAYEVDTRDSGTQLTLEDTSSASDVSSGTSYTLRQAWYDLPDDFGGWATNVMTYRHGDAVHYPSIRIVSADMLNQRFQHSEDYAYRPHLAALRPNPLTASTGLRWQVGFWRIPDGAYRIKYRYHVRPALISPTNKYPHGSQEHSRAILAAVMAEGVSDLDGTMDWDAKYVAAVERSKRFQSEMTAPKTLGYNGDQESFMDGERTISWGDGQTVNYDGHTLFTP